MSAAPTMRDPEGRFEALSALLAHDPGNSRLIIDTAEAAIAEGRLDEAEHLLAQGDDDAAEHAHLAALIDMRRERWHPAADRYRALLDAGVDAAPIRFNLAWSLAMVKDFDAANAVLDEATANSLPQAAALKVQMLHELGAFVEAEHSARILIEIFPDHRALNAAVAVLAIDIEDVELAEHCARTAGDHPDALATLGTLSLENDAPEEAAHLFDAALARSPQSPRAWVGRGLSRLLQDDKNQAAAELDRGAELFGTHIGSWIGAGWAHLIAGDLVSARARFEQALALDDNFAESHGSLAVIDILTGEVAEARRRLAIAQRLDRASFAAAMASMLLSAGEGDEARAAAIFEAALNTPIEGSGRTIAQSLARLAAKSG